MESLVWSRLKETTLLQFNSSINGIKFSPVAPYSVIALSGPSGPWIDGHTHQHTFSFAKTKSAFSAVAFRKDGILMALGREDGTVDTYPTGNHQTLHRRWKLGCGAVLALAFSSFSHELIVGCRNGSLQIVDVSSPSAVRAVEAHEDAVTDIRALDSGNLWVSGSTDCTIKVWDLTTPECLSCVACGDPVSHIVARGGRVFAAAGESVVVIDVMPRAAVVLRFVAHTRPIVALTLVRSNLVTASADRTIKVFDPTSFSLLHTMKVCTDIAAFDAKADASAIAIGLAGGVVELKFGAAAPAADAGDSPGTAQMPADFRVFKWEPPKKEAAWNRALRRFNVVDALDLVLETKDAPEIVGMIDELDRLGMLNAAIAGRDAVTLKPLLEFLVDNAAKPVWAAVVLRAVVVVEKIYRAVIADDPTVGGLFEKLVSAINLELETQMRASRLIGQIDVLLNSSV
jgi:U3 small nucleolar RNA-associated protein 15